MRPGTDEALWKQRYEKLAQFMADAKYEIEREGFDRCESRAWDPPQTVYVSFAFDVCDTEAYAIKNFGEGNYDVYRLQSVSPKDLEKPVKPDVEALWQAVDTYLWCLRDPKRTKPKEALEELRAACAAFAKPAKEAP